MFRGTTPTHFLWFNEVDPEISFKTMLVTYRQGGKIILEKSKADLDFGLTERFGEPCYYACLRLTQEETNLFTASKTSPVEIQVRAVDYGGGVIATNPIKISAVDVLNDEVLT